MEIVERQIRHIVIVILVVVLVTGTTAILLANVDSLERFSSFVFFVFMVGTIGGIANNYRRLQRMPLSAKEALKESPIAQRIVTVQIYLSPVIGGIFAVVLYVIFMSGFLRGDFFPAFQGVDAPFVNTPRFADCTLPLTNSDAAKALVWGFVAGFVERLVPNFIDGLAQELGAKEGSTEDKAVEEQTRQD